MKSLVVAALLVTAAAPLHAEQYLVTLTGTGGTTWLDGGPHLSGPFSITGLFDSSLTQVAPAAFTAWVDYTPITNVTFSSPAYTGPLADSFMRDTHGSNNGRREVFGFSWFGIALGPLDWNPPFTVPHATPGPAVFTEMFPFNPDSPVQARLQLITAPIPEPSTVMLVMSGLGLWGATRRRRA